jgi:IS605 OrfB family transposase
MVLSPIFIEMLKTVRVKILPTPDQKSLLLATMKVVNTACNGISEFAYHNRVFNRFELQKQVYRSVRTDHHLGAQMTILACRKVADSYYVSIKKHEELTLHTYRPRGAIAYDGRTYSVTNNGLSLWTVQGRIKVQPQTKYQLTNENEMDLCYDRSKNQFYVNMLINVPEAPQYQPTAYLGVDLGIVNIAATSDGAQVPGTNCERVRQWYQGRRQVLQRVGTRSAKRRLKQISTGESRFKKQINHIISKHLIVLAKDTSRGIALEDLTGIRERTTVRHTHRDRHSKWAFAQLRTFVQYKAKIAGVPVVLVDPAYTSQQCSVCGYTDRKNRKTRDGFSCISCNHAEPADINAAKNIAFRAAANQPMVTEASSAIFSIVIDDASSYKPPVLTGGS